MPYRPDTTSNLPHPCVYKALLYFLINSRALAKATMSATVGRERESEKRTNWVSLMAALKTLAVQKSITLRFDAA